MTEIKCIQSDSATFWSRVTMRLIFTILGERIQKP